MKKTNKNLYNKSGIAHILIIVGVILITLFLLAGVTYIKYISPSLNQTTDEALLNEEITATEPMADNEVEVIEMEAGAFYFTPQEIRVKKGQTIKLTLNSVDMMHDFKIDELGISTPVLKAGETSTIEFKVDEVGEYEYYCSVGQHKDRGQVGKLIVEE